MLMLRWVDDLQCKEPAMNNTLRTINGPVRLTAAVAAVIAAIMLAGCKTDAQTGAAIGSGLGAGAGAIIGYQSGHGWEGAAIGAGAGLLTGYLIGNESDKQNLHPNYDARNRSSYNANYDY
jgi:uncharacterized protein YcfJ